MHTELEKRIRDGDRTLHEFVSYLEEEAAGSGESTTISYRHLQRLISGQVAPNSVGAPIRRTLERTLGASIVTLLGPPAKMDSAPSSVALVVAIAVVTRAEDVLLVARRNEAPGMTTRWQFPAGIVKPGQKCATVAVEEALSETGVYSEVREYLGERIHPRTRVHCHYLACKYLWGNPKNLDPVENISVRWVPIDELHSLIPPEETFPAVLREMERVATSS